MTFGSKTTRSEFAFQDGTTVPSAKEHVLLKITINSRLAFYSHLKQLCEKVANKLSVLKSIAPYSNHNQRRLIYSSSFIGQFSYCPLIWTFPSSQSNHLTYKLQELALRIIYNDYDSNFSQLIEMSMTEIYNFSNDLSYSVMNDTFQKQENSYSLGNPASLVSKRKFTTTYGIDTISFREPQIWQDCPRDIKNSCSLKLFKSNFKRCETLTCHCKICKTLVPCMDYIDRPCDN